MPTDPASALTVPDAPTNVSASPVSAGEIDLTWDAMQGADTYTIVVTLDGGTDYSTVATGVTGTSYPDMTATPGTTQAYGVLAVDATGSSLGGLSNSVLTVPASQSDFAATPISTGEIDLSWTDVTGATSYTIQRKTGAGDFSPITSPALDGTETSFQDTTVSAGTSYTYEIVGTDDTGDSDPTDSSALTIPGTVSSLTSHIISNSEIDLSWAAPGGTVSGYRACARPAACSPSLAQTCLPARSVSNDTGLTSASTYSYKVLAFNTTGPGATTATGTLTTLTDAPTDVTASGTTTSSATIDWTGVTGATGYEIDHNDGQGWTDITTVDSSTFEYVDTGLNSGATYSYRVLGIDAGGASAPSDTADALTLAAGPATVTATPINAGEIDLTWDASNGRDTYIIFRKAGPGCSDRSRRASRRPAIRTPPRPAAPITPIRSSRSTPPATAAAPTAATVTTVPDAPTGFTAGAEFPVRRSTWPGPIPPGATLYEVDRQNLDSTWTPLDSTLGPAVDSYADTGLDAGTHYTYRVIAIDDTGPSLAADPESGLTSPAAPTTVVASPISAGEVDLTWDAMTGADTYSVSVSSDGGLTIPHWSPELLGTSYADTTVSGGTSYLYQIVATIATGDSDPGTSNERP